MQQKCDAAILYLRRILKKTFLCFLVQLPYESRTQREHRAQTFVLEDSKIVDEVNKTSRSVAVIATLASDNCVRFWNVRCITNDDNDNVTDQPVRKLRLLSKCALRITGINSGWK